MPFFQPVIIGGPTGATLISDAGAGVFAPCQETGTDTAAQASVNTPDQQTSYEHADDVADQSSDNAGVRQPFRWPRLFGPWGQQRDVRPVPGKKADLALASLLTTVYAQSRNPRNLILAHEDQQPQNRAVDEYEGLLAFTNALVENLAGGRDHREVKVCVAGHGPFYHSILALLRTGATVVSREHSRKRPVGMNHFDNPAVRSFAFERLSGHLKRGFAEICNALDRRRLIISNFDEEDAPTEYDMVIWEHPYPYGVEGEGLPAKIDMVVQNLKKGGLFVLQSDCPELFTGLIWQNSRSWRQILLASANDDTYLVPTMTTLSRGAVMVARRTRIRSELRAYRRDARFIELVERMFFSRRSG